MPLLESVLLIVAGGVLCWIGSELRLLLPRHRRESRAADIKTALDLRDRAKTQGVDPKDLDALAALMLTPKAPLQRLKRLWRKEEADKRTIRFQDEAGNENTARLATDAEVFLFNNWISAGTRACHLSGQDYEAVRSLRDQNLGEDVSRFLDEVLTARFTDFWTQYLDMLEGGALLDDLTTLLATRLGPMSDHDYKALVEEDDQVPGEVDEFRHAITQALAGLQHEPRVDQSMES